MRLTFDEIEIEGFKSYTKRVQLDLSKRGVGLHFVRGRNLQQPELGSNGAGKSTIWDALCWCLYGRTIEGLRNPDVTPWYGSERSMVTVRFRTDDKTHSITRTIKPNRLLLDGRVVGQDTIDELLRMPVEIFGHTILLGQDQPLFFDLKSSAKLELFATVLKLDRWDKYAEAASKRVKILERKQMLMEGEAAGIDRELQRVTKQFAEVKELSRQFQEERAKQIETANARLEELGEKLEAAEKKAGSAELALDSAGTELKALGIDIPKAEAELAKVQKTYDGHKELDWESRNHVERLKDELDQLAKSKTCPTCGQPIKVGDTKAQRKKLTKEMEGWQKSVGIPPTAKRKLEQHLKRVQTMRASEREFRDKSDDLLSKLRLLQPELNDLRQEIKVVKQLQEDRREVIDPHADLAQSLRRDKQRLTQEAREMIEELNKLARRHVRAKFWMKGFSEVRLYIINDILQELQLVTNGMLAEFGLNGWSVKYEIEQETKSGTTKRGIAVMVLSPKNNSFVNWKSWSSGEGQRLRIIGGLALSQVLLNHVGVEPAMEILDEPTAHLSVEGIDDLCELLAGRARDMGKQIWFTDHKVIEGAVFTSVLTVTKTKAGSMIDAKVTA